VLQYFLYLITNTRNASKHSFAALEMTISMTFYKQLIAQQQAQLNVV